MGYFSTLDQIQKDEYIDREEINVKDKMIKVIIKVYPKKSYLELASLEIGSLRGLYAQAKKRLKHLPNLELEEDIDNEQSYEDAEEYKR